MEEEQINEGVKLLKQKRDLVENFITILERKNSIHMAYSAANILGDEKFAEFLLNAVNKPYTDQLLEINAKIAAL